MKKQTLTLLILTLAFVLAGCAGHAAEEDTLHPLDAAAWPTPVPAQPTPQPTPFPKIDLDDVRVSYTQADDSDNAVVAPVVEVAAAEPAVETESAAAIDSQPAADTPATDSVAVAAPEPWSLAGLQPVTKGQVNISAVNVRQGPSPEAAKQAVLTSGQPVDVLGVNPTRDWALIQTPTLSGWVSLDYIDLADALDDAPVISPETTTVNVAAPVTTTAETQAPEPATSSSTAGDVQPATQDNPEQTVAHLGPIATAHIAVNKTDVRPGPSTEFAPIDELTDPVEQLTIVGVDPARQWTLVEPEFETSRLGWVALSDIEVSEGDLAAAPEVYTGWTNSNALALRTGPGIYTDEVGRLAINNLVRVVGLNDGRSWARVQPILGSGDGWTPIQYLTLSDKVASIPLAPVPPPAPEPEPI
ncbi:MAG: SH3 domain-containing protein, partial [Anaerolineae bacterium]|nr:SH3 domain-containing protein [Anaerolineae bacterium]